ncbi:ankyrin repeat domain-containing protein SOWAHC-like isoform X1 [Saccostrea cucullata]|uniref:ankyrin repeat domain-containing protein SOWAHC-like isoform X1 n=1 Tax=Saccostrea cuccullata TaxID=36930 RepID=UPI002ED2C029
MAASGFCLEAVKKFMIDNDCKVTNHELVTHFKSYLNDPDEKTQKFNREKFKEFVNTLAGIKTDERGEKILVLKKKFRPENVSTDSSRQESLPSSRSGSSSDPRGQGSDSVPKSQSYSSSSSSTDQTSEIPNSNHLSTASSISSAASTNSGPVTSEDDVNASIVSVKERAHHLNRMESESELQKMAEGQRVKGQRSPNEKGDPDDESNSSGSCYVSLDSEEKEWIVVSSTSEYHPIHRMLTKNPTLVNVKEFTSGYTALHLAAMHGHEDIIELLVSTYKADANLRDYSGKKAKQYLRNTASTKAQRLFGNDINVIAMGELLLSRKLGSSLGSVRSLDDSFTRSASFRRSKQVKAISSLIQGSSSGVKAMFRTTWAGSADDLIRNRHSRSRSPNSTPTGSGKSSPSPQRRETFASRSVDRELMPPPSAPVRKRREAQSGSDGNLATEDMTRTISEPTLNSGRLPKTYI